MIRGERLLVIATLLALAVTAVSVVLLRNFTDLSAIAVVGIALFLATASFTAFAVVATKLGY